MRLPNALTRCRGIALVAVTSLPAFAQVVIRPVPGTSATPASPAMPVRTVPSTTGAPGPAGQEPQLAGVVTQPGTAPAAAPKPPAADQRLQLALQARFDRRPSAILQAWAKPELKPYDPSEDAAADAAAGAAVPASTPPGEQPAAAPVAQPVAQPDAAPPDAPPPDAPPPDAAAAMAAQVEQQQAAAKEALRAQRTLRREIEIWQRDVTLGRWDRVGAFVNGFDEPNRKKLYEAMLKNLAAPPQPQQAPPGPDGQPPQPEPQANVPPQLQEKNTFRFEDVLALAGLAPGGVDKKQVPLLVPLLQRALEGGNVLESLLALLQHECERPAAEQRLSRRLCALVLAGMGQDVELGPFLPTVEEATAANDREAFNLMARHHVAMHRKEKKTVHLERAWAAVQGALAAGEIGEEEKAEALRRAVELAPRIQKDLGPAWLEKSFSERPERGMEIVATIGRQAARGFQEKPQDVEFRRLGLQLQKTAVDALFATAPQLAEQWRPTLALLAGNWIAEAVWSHRTSAADSLGPIMQRDEYGNWFYGPRPRSSGAVVPIEPAELLQTRPSGAWEASLGESVKPHLATVTAQLCLKVGEDAMAFPYIEQLAATNPRMGKQLATEFLQVWMRNHNPNDSSRTNRYMFMYGFEQRANAIPLTRSKQERNLEDLAKWVARLRALPIGTLDEQLLGQAFMTAHSAAEVYRLETIESVFGPLGELEPRLLATMLDTMRTNLATLWRLPAVQEANKTKRKQKDIEREVMNGYATAMTVAQRALKQHPDHWALLAAMAALLHDANNYGQELKKDSGFAEKRLAAFQLFAQAAANYAAAVPAMEESEETTRVFEAWFYGALGACDLGAVTEETVLAESQLEPIREALAAIPGEARERHLASFANLLFTRMSAVRPQIKYRYLDAGFRIVGDHERAYEAKKVFDYYQDLVHELRLAATVEGPVEVGTEPFGVRVDIEHTVEVERESGGFAKYLVNQNNQPYAYNYGRPTENYRAKFQEAVAQALNEHFEVLSVTFNADTATSISMAEPGWRRTPYAYLLLKAKGPQVDRLPAMKIDLDFLDTSGYAVLPIGSAPVPIDCTTAAGARPFTELEVTQTLDERKAEDGKLIVEVKATARGLVPRLDQIVDPVFAGFDVVKTDDQEVAVARFAEDQDGVRSERTWLLTLHAKEGTAPTRFRFAPARVDDAKAVYQRYADADLATVEAEVDLLQRYGDGTAWWVWALLGLAVVLAASLAFALRGRRGEGDGAAVLHLPAQLTPFTALALLRQIEARGRLDDGARTQLAASIATIERGYFARGEDAPDLRRLCEEWLQRAS